MESKMMQDEMILRLREYGESVMTSMKSNDPRIAASVQVTFQDGSRSTVSRSFAESAGDWLYVFSQQDGYFLFHKADVKNWSLQSTPTGTVLTHEPVARGHALQAA